MNWPNLLPDMYAYLPRKDVVSAFHATGKTSAWVECNGRVSDSFWASTKPSVHLIPSILDAGVKVMFFSGMQDLICNHVGTERMLDNMTWNGITGWGDGMREMDRYKQWTVDGKLAGTWTTRDNLTYVQIANASHMVGRVCLQPLASTDMLKSVINRRPLTMCRSSLTTCSAALPL